MTTFDKIYKIVSEIPYGKVTTYKTVAEHAGTNPKVVGYALHVNKDPQKIPCHRVINAKGQISSGYAFGGPHAQADLLKKEGVKINNEKIDLDEFGYFLF